MTYLIYFIIIDFFLAVLILIRINAITKMHARIQSEALSRIKKSTPNSLKSKNMNQALLKLHGIH